MIYKKYGVIVLSVGLFVLLGWGWLHIFSNVKNEKTIQLNCAQLYEEMGNDHTLDTTEKRMSKWTTYQKQCEQTGEYEMYLADFYLSKNDLNKSRELCEKIIQEKGDKFDTRMAEKLLMLANYMENKLEPAKNQAKLLMEKYPDWYVGYVYYGVSFILNNGDLLEAKKYLEKANELKESHDGLAWLAIVYYYEFDDYHKTLELFKKAIEINKVAILNREAAVAAAFSAINLNQWGFAQSMVTALKKVDKDIEKFSKYGELKEKIDNHSTESCKDS